MPVFLFFCFHSLAAADSSRKTGHFVIDQWTTKHGLPQNSVNQIIQTRDSYIWLATNEGLVRFDGVRFTVFNSINSPGMETDRLIDLVEDREGGLWIGTESGGLISYNDGVFQTFTTKDGLSGDTIVALFVDSGNTLWVVTQNGMNRLRPGGKISPFPGSEAESFPLILVVGEDRNGVIWMITRDQRILRLEEDQPVYFSSESGAPEIQGYFIEPDSRGNLWMGSSESLVRYTGGRFTVKSMGPYVVKAFEESRDGGIWIGLREGGGGLYRLEADELINVPLGEEEKDYAVLSLMEDHEGSLWIGTMANGLLRLKRSRFTVITEEDGLANNISLAVHEDSQGGLWAGTNGGGFTHILDGRFSTYTENDIPHIRYVWSLLTGSEGDLWVGTHGAGLYHGKDGHFELLSEENGLAGNFIRALYEDSRKRMWVGTLGNGVSVIEGKKIISYTKDMGLGGDSVIWILEDRTGDIWFAVYGGGLTRLRNGRLRNFALEEGLTNLFVRCLYEDMEGNLWIGTYGGGLFHFKNGRFTSIDRSRGLYDNVVSCIIEDDAGDFWMTSNKGIFRAARKDLLELVKGERTSITCTHYDESDGMANAECNGGFQPAGWKMRDGRIIFPTIKGAVILNPDDIPINRNPPPMHVEQVLGDGHAYGISSPLVFPRGTKRFEFRYTALSFLDPSKMEFRYKLEGYDKSWVTAGDRRTAHYTNLPPGKYTFRMMACNNDKIWNEEGAAVVFKLQPRFTQTALFYVLLGAGLFLSGIGLNSLRLRGLRNRKIELERLVTERTEELDAKNKDLRHEVAERTKAENDKAVLLKEIHHRVKNNLTMISSLLNLQCSSIQDDFSRNQLKKSQDRIRTIARLHDRLYCSKDLKSVDFADYIRDIVNHLGEIGSAGERNIRIETIIPKVHFSVKTAVTLALIINELVGNALEHAFWDQAGGLVTISLRKETDDHVLEVSDDGRGLAENIELTQMESLGFQLVSIFAEQVGGHLHIEKDKGTRFIIRFSRT
ncbi:MAG: two-component regulator propeller domain-containing protein [Candidatus Aminicenantes bacterium]